MPHYFAIVLGEIEHGGDLEAALEALHKLPGVSLVKVAHVAYDKESAGAYVAWDGDKPALAAALDAADIIAEVL
jgi:hypothetical protein